MLSFSKLVKHQNNQKTSREWLLSQHRLGLKVH